MFGLNPTTIKKVRALLSAFFDNMTMDFIGMRPEQVDKKIVINPGLSEDNLIDIYLTSLGTPTPNKIEEAALKNIIATTNDYMESLKSRTQAKALDKINAYAQAQSIKQENISSEVINQLLTDTIDSSKSVFKTIVNAEGNKARNIGTMMQIIKVADSQTVTDPIVFFKPTLDGRNDPETFRVHLLPDQLTPRLWKLSELNMGYYKKGDHVPSICGTQPNCRCKLNYLPKGYGFNGEGDLTYVGKDYNALEDQRNNYNMP